jgi:alpha-1,3-rhamnosyltransferase
MLQNAKENEVLLKDGSGQVNPLVSIIVITYNSANFVIETLESIKSQTYRNIELIISDDCSNDNTVAICRKWILKNRERFINTEVVTAEHNTGIPANCNRGLFKSIGTWIKYIAGDDLLTEDCIEKNLNYILKTDLGVIFSKKVNFTGESTNKRIISISKPSVFNDPGLTAGEQYRLLLRGIGCPPNTMFFKREVLLSVNGYEEEFPLFEDWPMNLKVTKAGFRIGFMNETTIYYRIHPNSVFHRGSEDIIYRDFENKSYHPAYMKYAFPNLSRIEKILYRYKAAVMKLFINTKLNRANLVNRALNFILLSPYNLNRSFKIAQIKNQKRLYK